MERALTYDYDRLWLAQETKLKEQELIASILNGDTNAFKEIVRKYESRVAATVIGMLGHCTEAEDIGQETFVRLYQSLHKFRGESSLATYLTRIAINLSLNEIRRRGRRRQIYLTNSEEKIEKIADTANHNEQKEMSELIQNGLQKLPAKFRTVIVLRLIDGYSTEETAKILNLPVGTVLSRLSRAQIKLKKVLAPLYQGEI
jgi:RNA polymerase sigma-70 factor (ECF subfamily)